MITLNDSVMDAVVKMAQGNPGAATVLAKIIQADPIGGFIDICHMDDMGLKGPAIWVAYKDFAKNDLTVLTEAVRSRSKDLIAAVRAEGFEAHSYGQS